MRAICMGLVALFVWAAVPAVGAPEEWEVILQDALGSDYSQTRHDGVKGIDTSTEKGLKTLWKVLAIDDPDRVDWYVREAAYEALLRAEGEEADEEIARALDGRGNEAAKEAIVYAVIWKIRKEFVKAEGGNDDRLIEDAKYRLRKTRGTAYFELILPTLRSVDPDGKLFRRIEKAFEDKSPRVQRAAIAGFLAYPKEGSIEQLLSWLEKNERKKQRQYTEWVQARFALETLTGEEFGEDLESWRKWWDAEKEGFSIEELVEKEKAEAEKKGTTTVTRDGVEFPVTVKEHGQGYPLIVLPWRQYEPDYFRPYFHGIEEFCRVFYVAMPKVDDYKGLARDATSNHVQYPTALLAAGLAEVMAQSGLDHFAVLGHGPDSATLAMMVAAQHPDKVTHLILINPRSAGERYTDSIENVIKTGKQRKCREIEKGGENLFIMENGRPMYEPSDAAEAAGNMRAIQNLRFADPTAPEVGQLEYMYTSADTASVIADNKWSLQSIFGTKPYEGPTLIFMGTANPWTPQADMTRVAGFFPRAIPVVLKRASEMPFMSETITFTAHMKKLLAGARRSGR